MTIRAAPIERKVKIRIIGNFCCKCQESMLSLIMFLQDECIYTHHGSCTNTQHLNDARDEIKRAQHNVKCLKFWCILFVNRDISEACDLKS